MCASQNISVFILCGGKSSRMQAEKGLVIFNQKPFIKHILEAVEPLNSSITLVTQNKAYSIFGYPLIQDIYTEKGPLGGIHTALKHSNSPDNLILSCDIPLITTTALKSLINTHSKNEAAITLAYAKKKLHPLIAVYNKNLVTKIEDYLKEDRLKLLDFINEMGYKTVEQIEANQLQNINSKLDLEKIEA